MISLIPILLLSTIIVLLISLAVGLWLFTKRNKPHKTLIIIIAIWVVMFVMLFVDKISEYNEQASPVVGVMNFHYIWMGLIGLFSLMSYPAVVLNNNTKSMRRSLLWLLPILLIIIIYIVWHLLTGVSMNYRYSNYTELWESRLTIPVILRILMISSFVIYLMLYLRRIWKLIPIYEKYSEDNYTDNANNIGWLRLVVLAIGSMCTAYLIVFIWEMDITGLFYSVVTAVSFTMLSINAFSHKIFVASDNIDVYWSYRNGWQMIKKCDTSFVAQTEYTHLETILNSWIKSEKPFTNYEFTASNIYNVFPALRYPVLTTLLAKRGHTFKSYVRELRIQEACYIMETQPQLLCKQIAFKVGFSSSEAFSRAFIAVTGKTPIEFRKE